MELPECGVEVAAVFLLTHCQIQHGVERGDGDGGDIDVVPDVFIWTVNWLHYLNYEVIPRT